ncbi:MmcQ/YjbR family DNA-binding protein [Nakamurella sp. YIM 132087]|uniref:MmcQ/YjbR family DNA-binding protein n=1 Tax=Nakamurella alba TaxID=2665158 RepID=A0A7K1FIS2_9ACTN|nr:MmcQ/YjbR family DNA-binding protein [Nakamurella alba]MTD13163.1 MmcQ/YjbR family DNA-binding protein [Nakamurella alba]
MVDAGVPQDVVTYLGRQPAALRKVHRWCLRLPDTTVKQSHGSPTYQVRGKSYASTMHDHHASGRTELWAKGAPGAQQTWIEEDPDRYYRPAYVGPSGWVGAWLDVDVDWPAIAEILVEGYLDRLPPRAAAAVDGPALVAVLRKVR